MESDQANMLHGQYSAVAGQRQDEWKCLRESPAACIADFTHRKRGSKAEMAYPEMPKSPIFNRLARSDPS